LKLRQEALQGIAKCHEDAYWPSYTDEQPAVLSLPSWAY
jgi:hypothetical protein